MESGDSSVGLLSHVEDQADEDFFDKLINDEFETPHTNTTHLGDAGGLPVDSEDMPNNHLYPLIESQKVDQINSLTSKMDILEEKNMVMETLKSCAYENIVLDGDTQSAMIDAEIKGDSDNLSEAVNIFKDDSTSVKEVQWSAFESRPGEHQLLGDFGSFSDFLTDNSTVFSDTSTTNVESSASIDRNTITKSSASSWSGSLEYQHQQNGSEVEVVNGKSEQDGQKPPRLNSPHEQDGQTSLDANDPLYWEKIYPGWKYDFNTGQWYQVATDAGDSSSNGQLDGSVANSEASFQPKTESASAYENMQADNYNSISNSITGYPENMVFDPQYPGWYYDTNTQQWQTLESYAQMLSTAMVVQNKLTSGNSSASDSYFLEQKYSLYCNDVNQFDDHKPQDQFHKEVHCEDLSRSVNNNYSQLTWQSKVVDGGHGIGSTLHGNSNEATAATSQGFIPGQNMYQYNLTPKVEQGQHYEDTSHSYYGHSNPTNHSHRSFQSGNLSHSQMSYSMEGLSSAGRPLHALVTLGFGGKLVVMKNTTLGTGLNTFGNQDGCGGTISILNMMDVIMEKTNSSIDALNGVDYFNSLCNQSFPGPLVGGNAASKDLNKWIDARIAACEMSSFDLRKQQILRLLLSLLKISHQYYGKLRSPFGTDPSLLENDGPETAVTNLFASSRNDNISMREHGAFTNCMHNFPSEGQIQATASEVQTLLVFGKRKEALQCAQEGMLWGPALVLAAQIGEKFYIDTVKKMAHNLFISGSPLRTLCLLIAGQPADVFSNGSMSSSFSNKVNLPQQFDQPLANSMLDDWEENLAVICANRTKDDELVIMHLGDCLWKELGEIAAAHTCYLVAEVNFESYSDAARLCLVGADHWNCPRTFATPKTIQWTEFYEYTKVLGNSQFQLLTFQPYKLVYAHMLAEVGKVSDSLKYCQTISKLLKSIGRSAEVEMWKFSVSSLEERLRLHQQGGYVTSLAPGKLVGKFFTSIDKSIHRMIGSPPLSSLPAMPENKVQQHNDYHNFSMVPKVTASQSTMAMPTMIPSASVETNTDWNGGKKSNFNNGSVSESDFGRSPKQAQPSDAVSSDMKTKDSSSGGSSRFGSFGSIIFQKTLGWVSKVRTDKQAKLGEDNKFYYDENLKRWVEKGVDPLPEEAAPPPPPIMTSFQEGQPDYNVKSALKTQNSLPNEEMVGKPPMSLQHNSSIPSIPPSQNQFSMRGRMGVRSRYVDTFNKDAERVTGSSSFLASANQSIKPIIGGNFFVPTPLTSASETAENSTQNICERSSSGEVSSVEASTSSHYPPLASYSMQKFSSMDTITNLTSSSLNTIPSRATSWSGSISDEPDSVDKHHSSLSSDSKKSKQASESIKETRDISQTSNGGFGDDLQEVNL